MRYVLFIVALVVMTACLATKIGTVLSYAVYLGLFLFVIYQKNMEKKQKEESAPKGCFSKNR